MEKLLGDYAPQVYALLRIVVGFLFFCHGLQKFLASSAASTARVQLLRSFSLFGVARCRQVNSPRRDTSLVTHSPCALLLPAGGEKC